MSDIHSKKLILFLAAGAVALIVVVLFVVSPLLSAPEASSRAPAAVPIPAPLPRSSSTQLKISWSAPELTQTMFPGSSATVSVSFQSDQNVIGVTVDIAPSLEGIVVANPAKFVSVSANQPYEITFTLTAPPKFIKQSFGGVILLGSTDQPSQTYALPLAVNLQTDWNTVTPDGLFSLNLPLDFEIADKSTTNSYDTHAYLITLNDPTVPDWLRVVGTIWAYTPQQWAAALEAEEHPLKLTQADGFVWAYGMSQGPPPKEQAAEKEFLIAIGTFRPL
jgi:hypothetical protein